MVIVLFCLLYFNHRFAGTCTASHDATVRDGTRRSKNLKKTALDSVSTLNMPRGYYIIIITVLILI